VCSSDLDREDRHGHQNSHTFYLRYQGPLLAANDVKVDITIKEVLCFPLQDRPIHRTYDGFDDLPEGPTVKVYALEEIVLEKLLALSDHARNEPRDLYDLWHLLNATDLRIAELRTELDAKLAHRQRTAAGIEQAVAKKEERLRRLWAARLAHQMNLLPPFDDVFREVLRAVRAAGLPKLDA
jgi:predicted nucleotidyltransferase component of viral defense system